MPDSFGELLRRYRVAAGLSQEALAERAGLSAHGISDLERGARTRPYPATVQRLVVALGLSEADRARLHGAARHVVAARPSSMMDVPARGQPGCTAVSTTELSSFIGREHELVELGRLLPTTRLLTLIGVGGVGKTRLALRLAAQEQHHYVDGVWLVELAPLAEPRLVATVVAGAFGLVDSGDPEQPLDRVLAAALRSRQLLLVLDNCEHLVEACAELAEHLLRACPGLTVLATSREPLGIAGERVWSVPPLSLPDPRRLPRVEELRQYEAVRLFEERATAAPPGFVLTEAHASAVAEVCRHLDGIPLALELAAARVKVLSPEQIAARLGDRFRLLTGGSRTAPARQQTLRATLEWSYALLTASEQRLFERLAVFAGGWTLEAAEAVCGGDGLEPGEVLDLLTRLVDKSLVPTRQEAAQTRYRLLETVREFSLERLAAAGDLQQRRKRHAAYFLVLAEQLQLSQVGGPQQVLSWERLEQDLDNLRAALRWLMDQGDATRAQRLGGALRQFWLMSNRLSEGRAWLAELAALPGGSERTLERAKCLIGLCAATATLGAYAAAREAGEEAVSIAREAGDGLVLAQALYWQGQETWWRGDYGRAAALAEEGLTISRAAGHGPMVSRCLYVLAGATYESADYASAQRWAEQAYALAREAQDARATAMALKVLGRAVHQQGEIRAARALLEDSLANFRLSQWPWGEAWVLTTLGWVALDEGDFAHARALFARSLALHQELGSRTRVLEPIEGFAQLAAAEGRSERALRLVAAAAAQRAVTGAPLSPTEQRQLARWLEPARRALSPVLVAEATAQGQALTLEQAIAEALADDGSGTTEYPVDG